MTTYQADSLRNEIRELIVGIERHISVLTKVLNESGDMGGHTLALRTHNLDVAKSGGLLHSTIPLDIEHTITHYQVVLQSFQNYLLEL